MMVAIDGGTQGEDCGGHLTIERLDLPDAAGVEAGFDLADWETDARAAGGGE